MGIAEAVANASAYLSDHPDEARYRDSSAHARVETGLAVTVSGPALQGRVTTNTHGGWKIEVMHAGGHYFAVAPEQKAMHMRCGRAKSRLVDVM